MIDQEKAFEAVRRTFSSDRNGEIAALLKLFIENRNFEGGDEIRGRVASNEQFLHVGMKGAMSVTQAMAKASNDPKVMLLLIKAALDEGSIDAEEHKQAKVEFIKMITPQLNLMVLGVFLGVALASGVEEKK